MAGTTRAGGVAGMAGRGGLEAGQLSCELRTGKPKREGGSVSGGPAFTVHGCPLVVAWRKGGQQSQLVGSATQTDTRTEQCWDPLFPAVSLSSEALVDPQTYCWCSLRDPQCVSPAAGPQRERCVPLTQPHQSSPRPVPPPAFLSILQWTPWAHHPSPYESTVHMETPQPSEPQDVGSSPGGPPPLDTAAWSHLGPACSWGWPSGLVPVVLPLPPPAFPDVPRGPVLIATQPHSTEVLIGPRRCQAHLGPSLLMAGCLGLMESTAGLHSAPPHPSQPCSGCEV